MRRALAVILLALLLGLALSAAAAAGPARYVLEKCDPALPGGGTEGATFHGQPPYAGANNCNEPGGSIFIVQQGDVGTSSSYWSLPLPAPPGGLTESVTVTGSMCNGANRDAGTVAFAVGPGWPLNCTGETRTFPVNSPAGSAGLVWLSCVGHCVAAPEAWAASFAATEVDPVAPRVESLGGSVLSGAPLRGHQTIDGQASDQGGGIRSMTVRVNGQPLEPSHDFPCRTAWVSNPSYVGVVAINVTPCPASAEASWTLDTGAPPFQEGVNAVAVCGKDFATIGTPNEGCSTRSVYVDNSCVESPDLGAKVLNARFARSRSSRITVPYGRPARLVGRLSDSGGNPVGGATICVEARTATATGTKSLVQLLTSDADGRFSYHLAPGPNRAILIAYRHDAEQLERHLRYGAHARPSLRPSARRLRNGQRIRFHGRLPGPQSRGRVVVLQANVVGAHRWITFRRATSNRRGTFHASYHFSATTRTTRYRFRAVVPQQAGYPWAAGHSRAVQVLVKG